MNLSFATRCGQPLRFLLVDLGLDLLDERQHVAHAEDARGHAVGMEDVEVGVLLADADELDRAVDDRLDRERRAAAGVAVELRQHDAGDAEAVVELLRRLHGVLAGHGVGDEEDLARPHVVLDRVELLHQLFVDVQAAGGVEDDGVVEQRLRLA